MGQHGFYLNKKLFWIVAAELWRMIIKLRQGKKVAGIRISKLMIN